MFRTLSFSLLAALGGLCLGSCSQHESPSAASAGITDSTAAVATKPRNAGTRVDSLNGVPGHPFGELLSAFPGLIKSDTNTPGMVTYRFPEGSPNQLAWFAKHKEEVPGVFYLFRDGKFSVFRAVAYSAQGQAALAQEAAFLFGPGRVLGERTEWGGETAWAALAGASLNGQNVKILEVGSRVLEQQQQQNQQARLKAENAGQ